MGAPGNHYNTVLVSDEESLFLYDFRVCRVVSIIITFYLLV